MHGIIKGKSILITGATGSFGEELLLGILKYSPRVVRVFSRDETKQFCLLQKLGKRKDVRYFVGDVRDCDRLVHAMEGVDYVFHLAAMKHVVACEYNPFEAMKTNIMGTANVIEAAIAAKVKKVIFTSTDKAVNPSNVMGSSKLFAERLVTAAHYYRGTHDTVFCTVRFGNVLGTRGSIIPIIDEQIRSGNTVTVTDGSMERFIMSLAQCIDLVFKVMEISAGGEVFVLKMPLVRVGDLVQVLIDLIAPKYGKKPKDIKVKLIGAMPGEKHVEELLTDEERSRCQELKDMYVVLPQMKHLMGHKSFDKLKDKYGRVKAPGKKYLSRKEIAELLKQFEII